MKRGIRLVISLVGMLGIMTQVMAAGEQKPKIGFIPMTMANEYFVTMVNAAKMEAAKQGVELVVNAGATHGSVAEQVQIIQEMIAQQVQAICIVPTSSEGVIGSLVMAHQAGIHLINIDTKLDPEIVKSAGLEPIPFLGTNNYDGAKMGGEYALQALNIAGQKAVILTGIAEQQNAKDRRNGFRDAVAGQVTIVAEQSANWSMEEGYAVLLEILQAHPDVKVVFASNDNMALGAIRALQEFGRKDVLVMGYDAIGSALDAVEQGQLAATVAQFPAEMGVQGIQLAFTKIHGGSIPEITYTKTEVIDAAKVAAFKTYLAQYR